MCLATPLKLKKVKDKTGTVSHNGKDFDVSLSLIPEASVGDWILAHGEIAISVLPEKDALDILNLIHQSESEN